MLPFERTEEQIPPESRVFLQKTARSLVEIQPDLHTITDIIVFLEVLGYTNKQAMEKGFRDLYDFACALYEFIDHYVDPPRSGGGSSGVLAVEIPSPARRLGEALSLSFPWLSSLLVLFVFGVSLWLVWGLPLSVTTALIVGLFLGLVTSEGPLQVFQRLFVFHSDQGNLPEVKRVLKRSYMVLGVLVASVLGTLFLGGLLAGVPLTLISLSAVAAVTMLANRMAYVTVYALKKFGQLLASYALAIVSLLAVYFVLYNFIPQTLTRYLDSLGVAFIVLMITPVYYGYRVFSASSTTSLKGGVRHALNPLISNSRTIRSRFSIQIWENAPFYLFGTLFFVMLFGDRVMAWRFNPIHVANGIHLPLVFNTAYHLGADLALLVIFPAAMVQYVIMTPVTDELTNLSVETGVGEQWKINDLIRSRYAELALYSVVLSSLVALALVVFAPQIMAHLSAPPASVRVLQVAAVSNVFIAVFAGNALFLMFMNRAKSLVGIAAVSVGILVVGGYLLGEMGFQEIVYAYLISALSAMTLTLAQVADVWNKTGSTFFAKYT